MSEFDATRGGFGHISDMRVQDAALFVRRWHYQRKMPRLTKLALGLFRGADCIGCITFGWGVRPLNTIQRLFPSLSTKDYYEIGRMCATDNEPRNTETQLLSLSMAYLRKAAPQVKVLFTWADGFWGKPGYVYQAANFLYGGFSWTDRYIDAQGRLIHPLGSKKSGGQSSDGRTRPSVKEQREMGWARWYGKQFRYVYFMCGHKERKCLLRESTVQWNRDYPKHKDLLWRLAGESSRVSSEIPFAGEVQSLDPAPV